MSKEKLLLVGAGGFGRMVAEQAMLQYDCAFVDDGQPVGIANMLFGYCTNFLTCDKNF